MSIDINNAGTRVARSIEELFPLIEYCKAGDLRAASDWIAQGKPLNPPPGKKTRRRTPLQVAIEKGFLTLTETLLEGGADPLANGNALHSAIDHKRADIVTLLLDRGSHVLGEVAHGTVESAARFVEANHASVKHHRRGSGRITW